MKKTVIWLIVLCLFIGCIIGAFLLYEKLSADYGNSNLTEVNPPSTDSDNNVGDENSEETDTGKGEDNLHKNTATDFKVLDSSGKEVNLSDFFGRPIVINFWATWCVYCKEEMPDFNRAKAENPDVLFMMVNVGESIEKGTAYIKGEGFMLEAFFDLDYSAAKAYGVTGYPTTFFIDANGNLVSYARGKINYNTLIKGIKSITE